LVSQSRTGTFVSRAKGWKRVESRTDLVDGDRIRLGPDEERGAVFRFTHPAKPSVGALTIYSNISSSSRKSWSRRFSGVEFTNRLIKDPKFEFDFETNALAPLRYVDESVDYVEIRQITDSEHPCFKQHGGESRLFSVVDCRMHSVRAPRLLCG